MSKEAYYYVVVGFAGADSEGLPIAVIPPYLMEQLAEDLRLDNLEENSPFELAQQVEFISDIETLEAFCKGYIEEFKENMGE